MKWFDSKGKKVGAAMGSVAALWAVVTVIPGNTKAIAGPTSTAVTVTNTPLPVSVTNTAVPVTGSVAVSGFSGTPVFRNADEPGRAPYQVRAVGLTSTVCNEFGCLVKFPAVPAGRRLVVQHVSGFFQPKAGSVPARIGLYSTVLGVSVASEFFATVQGGGAFTDIIFDQPVLAYFDAGDQPGVWIDQVSIDTSSPNNTQVASLNGYLVDCSAANSCAPIVR